MVRERDAAVDIARYDGDFVLTSAKHFKYAVPTHRTRHEPGNPIRLSSEEQ